MVSICEILNRSRIAAFNQMLTVTARLSGSISATRTSPRSRASIASCTVDRTAGSTMSRSARDSQSSSIRACRSAMASTVARGRGGGATYDGAVDANSPDARGTGFEELAEAVARMTELTAALAARLEDAERAAAEA